MEEIDLTEDLGSLQPKEIVEQKETKKASFHGREGKDLINCLRNEKVKVKFIPKVRGLVTDPKHVLYGGLGVNSKKFFVVPLLTSNVFMNVLTNSEKDFLEYIMGYEPNYMSVYKKVDNFWANRGVALGKDTVILDLSVPDDYIKYKILLANPDYIASSEQVLKEARKETHQFVIVHESDEIKDASESLNKSSKAYMLFGENKDNLEKLALVIELATGKHLSKITEKSIFPHIESLINNNVDKFINTLEDEFLDIKLLLFQAVSAGYVRKKGHYYYFTENNAPICADNQEPTLQSACLYLSAPKNQSIKFALEAKIKEK